MSKNAAPETAPTQRKRRFLRFVFLLVVPVFAVYGAAQYYLASGGSIDTDNAYVKARLHNLSSEIDGRVQFVLVKENERVKTGQTIIELDPEPYEIAIRAAQANLAAIHQDLKSLRSEYRRSSVDIALAKKRIAYLTTRYERQKKLRATGVSSIARLDEAAFQLQIAEQELRSAQEQRRKLLTDLGGDPAAVKDTHPDVQRATAEVERAQLDLRRTQIVAPADAVVARIKSEPGEVVEAMEPIVLLVDQNDIWIEANLKETKLTHIRVGQEAEIIVDAYPDATWRARVESIAPATGAEFALLPPQNASGNWVKVVQRLPIRLSVIDPRQSLALRAGMTATVSIETSHKPQLPAIVKQALALTERFQGK
ncbi:MAG: HlyD family secretion protein [Alphaproteobacteria bacterium]|nr:HlyD family secretion protein [Alphaproteobacteria bacterium]